MKILITDGEGRSSLAATRSLGKKGHDIFVTGLRRKTISSQSRYCSKGIHVPDSSVDCLVYAQIICEITIREGIDIILPMTEQSIYALNPIRLQLPENVILACPESDKITALSDKVKLYQLAEKLGIAIPKTLYLENEKSLPALIGQIKSFPVVIKPSLSRVAVDGGFLKTTVTYARSVHELEKQYAGNPALAFPSMVQEKIVGPGTGLFSLYDKNQHLAVFSHQRLREKPPSGGVSVVSASVPLDKEMVMVSDKLLRSVNWSGVAMIEFKRDVRDGRAKLMEVNGRFWGTLQLAISCGVDFPALLVDYLQGKKIHPMQSNYKTGHEMKWILGLLDHFLILLKNREMRKNAFVSDVFKRDASFDVFDSNDIAPFVWELREYLGSLWLKKK